MPDREMPTQIGQFRHVLALELVTGHLPTQGSMVAHVVRRGDGRLVTRGDGSPLVVTHPQNPVELRQWRFAIAAEAKEQLLHGPSRAPFLAVYRFAIPRPGSHYGSGRNSNLIRASAPARPVRRPDLDKLSRAVNDALSKVAWLDDSQVCLTVQEKSYVGREERHRLLIDLYEGPALAADAQDRQLDLFEALQEVAHGAS